MIVYTLRSIKTRKSRVATEKLITPSGNKISQQADLMRVSFRIRIISGKSEKKGQLIGLPF